MRTIKNNSLTPREQDLYESFIEGHLGIFRKEEVIPRDFTQFDVEHVDRLVLKPDGEFFPLAYPRIGTGTKKGDVAPRDVCLLRYLRSLLPRAEIRRSGGTEASFHVVIDVDETVSQCLRSDGDRFSRLLQGLRVLTFCDKVGDGILSALMARHVGSINSKTGRRVEEVQPATGTYSLEELEGTVENWLDQPEVTLVRTWFGVDTERCRCPFHDSNDTDLSIRSIGEKYGPSVACFGTKHCAKDQASGVARIPMVSKAGSGPSVIGLILEDGKYRQKWIREFKRLRRKERPKGGLQRAGEFAARQGKQLIVIDEGTSPDELLIGVRDALVARSEVYCDPSGVLVTLEQNLATRVMEIHRHDTVDKFIALVDRAALIVEQSSRSTKYRSLPRDRAAALFHRPKLRQGLSVLVRVSRAPVLDVSQKRVLPRGYDPTSRVCYDGPEITPRTDGKTPVLDKLLSGWTGMCGSPHRSCVGDADIANLYAAFFTEVLADTGLFTLHRHPLFRGNQKGLGKDKLAECLGILRDGETPVDLDHTDENRINQGFGNGVHAGRRTFQVSNIRGRRPYSNPMLTRWLTSESLTRPKHGGGTWRICPNTVTVVFTLNQGSIDDDLFDRLLPIDLEVEGDARKRRFDFDPVVYVREHRTEILSEILGLAIRFLEEGQEWNIPDGMDRRFDRWMKAIGGLLELRGLPGFMTNLEPATEEGDLRRVEFAELARRVYTRKGNEKLTASEILRFCRDERRDSGEHGECLFAREVGSRAPASSLAKYVLKPFVDEKITVRGSREEDGTGEVLVLRSEKDKRNKRSLYWFERDGGGCGGMPKCPPPRQPLSGGEVTVGPGGCGGIH